MTDSIELSHPDFLKHKASFHKLIKSNKTIDSDLAESIIRSLLGLGIDDPVNCNCVESGLVEGSFYLYRHQNHRSYNHDFWKMIPKDLFAELRVALMEKTNGDIDLRGTGKRLLANFLFDKGMETNWI
ncbi:MAG: hypothetical protein EXS48_02155 [Candidatus Staskawiczbacteria bacterium]|nr:hypothetical protein [Candidatus Staskawiczbacteria bacterium]